MDAHQEGNSYPGSGINAPLDELGRTSLHKAVEEENRDEILRLLKHKANPNQKDIGGRTPLYTAIQKKDMSLISALVEKGASFSVRDALDMTPLAFAIVSHADPFFLDQLKTLGADPHLKLPEGMTILMMVSKLETPESLVAMEWLVKNGANPDQRDKQGSAAIHYAIEAGSAPSIRKLIGLGADPNIRTDEVKTPLYLAAESGKEAIVDVLLENAEVRRKINEYKDSEGSRNFTPLLKAVLGNHISIASKMIDAGADMNQTDYQTRNALFIAVESGHRDMVEMLIEKGVDIAKAPLSKPHRMTSMLHWVYNGSDFFETVMPMLVAAGANLDIRDEEGRTPLYKATEARHVSRIRIFLELGADPNIGDNNGLRPLDIACSQTYYDTSNDAIIALFLEKKVSVDISPNPAALQAPLHFAAKNGILPAAETLIRHGAAVDLPDRDKSATPYLLAAKGGHFDVMKMLEAQGVNIHAKDSYQRTALHLAARAGKVEMVEHLLTKLEIDVNAKDGKGLTALMHACRKGRMDCVALLLQNGADFSAVDQDGKTALHHAVVANNADILSVFAERFPKMDWNMPVKETLDTSLHLAVARGLFSVIERLLLLDADMMRTDKNGVSPVHLAVVAGDEYIINTILLRAAEKHIDINALKDHNGWTPLHYAATREAPDMLSLLKAANADFLSKTYSGDTVFHIAVRAGRDVVAQWLCENEGAGLLIANKAGETPLDIALKFDRQEVIPLLQNAIRQQEAPRRQQLSRLKGPGM